MGVPERTLACPGQEVLEKQGLKKQRRIKICVGINQTPLFMGGEFVSYRNGRSGKHGFTAIYSANLCIRELDRYYSSTGKIYWALCGTDMPKAFLRPKVLGLM